MEYDDDDDLKREKCNQNILHPPHKVGLGVRSYKVKIRSQIVQVSNKVKIGLNVKIQLSIPSNHQKKDHKLKNYLNFCNFFDFTEIRALNFFSNEGI
jgi:hypothetical protein